MADKKVTVTIEAVDKASQVIAEVSKQLESLSGIGKGGGFKNLTTFMFILSSVKCITSMPASHIAHKVFIGYLNS